MVTENTLIKFGLTKDENNLKLKEVFKDNIELKEIYIDIYPVNPLVNHTAPFMLLLRNFEKRVTISNEGDRLIVKKSDTYLMNVLFSEITECYYKSYVDYFEFILKIQNIYYTITVFN